MELQRLFSPRKSRLIVAGFCVLLSFGFVIFQNFSDFPVSGFAYTFPFKNVKFTGGGINSVGSIGDRANIPLAKVGFWNGFGQGANTWDGRLYSTFLPANPIFLPPTFAASQTFTQAGSSPVGGNQILPYSKSGTNEWSYTCGTVTFSLSPTTCLFTIVDTSVGQTPVFSVPGDAITCNNPTLVFQGDSNLVLYNNSNTAPYWASNTSHAPSQTTSNANIMNFYSQSPYIMILNPALNQAYFDTVTSSLPAQSAVDFYLFSPEKMSSNAQSRLQAEGTNPPFYSPYDGNSVLFSLGYAFTNPSSHIVATYNLSDSNGHTMTPSQYTYYFGNYYGSTNTMAASGISLGGAIGMARNPTYPTNPYPSDANGNACSPGCTAPYFMTYQILMFSAESLCGAAPCQTPPLSPGNLNFSALTPIQVVVQSPYTASANVGNMKLTAQPKALLDINGNGIPGVESSATTDAQLYIFHDIPYLGHLSYTFNPNLQSGTNISQWSTGWSSPQDVSYMYTDNQMGSSGSGIYLKNYPFTRYQMLDGLGNPINNGTPARGQFAGAYPWMSEDGSDLFYQAIQPNGEAMRVGSSAVGASTHGIVRLLDGGANTTRGCVICEQVGQSNYYGGFVKTTVSSFGRTPGMWTSLDFADYKVLPLTDKPFTYPMINNASLVYYEASFEESMAGNYDVFLDMSEPIQYNHAVPNYQAGTSYVTNSVQDISGNLHVGTLGPGAAFPEEAFPTATTLPAGLKVGPCLRDTCPMDDPWNQFNDLNIANATGLGASFSYPAPPVLFSGKAAYFQDGSQLTINPTSKFGTILGGGAAPLPNSNLTQTQATDLTVSVAVLPVESPSAWRYLAAKSGTFSIVLEQNLAITARLDLPLGTQGVFAGCATLGSTPPTQECTIGFSGISNNGQFNSLPLNQWSHVAMTYQSSTGIFSVYINGQQAIQGGGNPATLQMSAPTPIAVNLTSPVHLGPTQGVPGTPGNFAYALDSFEISRVVRTQPELMRLAGAVFPRVPTSSSANHLPTGIKMSNIKSPILATRALDADTVALGNDLFFDTRLSPDNTVSCATCHTNGHGQAEPIPLHASRLAAFGGAPHLLRNVPSIAYMGFNELFFRDGRSSSLFNQAGTVLGNAVEMGPNVSIAVQNIANDPAYASLFATAFAKYPGAQSTSITAENIELALQEYELSLMTQDAGGNSPTDQYMAGNLSALNAQQIHGRDLFYGKARCADCHSGSGFTDEAYHVIPFVSAVNGDGITDGGRFNSTYGFDDSYKFRTPSLRNVKRTSPFYHNGSIGNTNAAAHGYNNLFSGGKLVKNLPGAALDNKLMPLNLSSSDFSDLGTFIQAISYNSGPATTQPSFAYPTPPPSQVVFTPSMYPLNADGKAHVLNGASYTLQTNGILSITSFIGGSAWTSGPANPNCTAQAVCKMVMTSTGNLTLQDSHGTVYWQTGTQQPPGSTYQLTISGTMPFLSILPVGEISNQYVWAAYESTVLENFQIVTKNNVASTANFGNGSALTLSTSGDLILFSGAGSSSAKQVWHTNTSSTCNVGLCSAIFQGDGNFVMYNNGNYYWNSSTPGFPNYVLSVQTTTANTAYLKICSNTWSGAASVNCQWEGVAKSSGGGVWLNGPTVWTQPTQVVADFDGGIRMIMTNTGDIQALTKGGTPAQTLVGDTGTGGVCSGPNYVYCTLIFQGDGNLMIYGYKALGQASTAVWASNTGNPTRSPQYSINSQSTSPYIWIDLPGTSAPYPWSIPP